MHAWFWAYSFMTDSHVYLDNGLCLLQVKALETDLQDGLLLVELLDKLAAPKSVGRYSRRPINKVQMLENIGKALWFIHEQNIKLVNIGKEKNNVKMKKGWVSCMVLLTFGNSGQHECLYGHTHSMNFVS